MYDFYKLFNGEIGKVIHEEFWNEDDGTLLIDGKQYEVSEEVCSIDDFNFEEKDLFLLWSEEGYRGDGCYSGYVKREDGVYYLDIINEYMVLKCEEITELQ